MRTEFKCALEVFSKYLSEEILLDSVVIPKVPRHN